MKNDRPRRAQLAVLYAALANDLVDWKRRHKDTDEDDDPRADAGELVPLAAGEPRPVAPPISVDDVLDVHRFLDGFTGGTVTLLERLEGGSPE